MFCCTLLYVHSSIAYILMGKRDRNAFFTSENPKKYHAWSCQNVCDALIFLLDNIFIRFGTKLYRQVVGILWALIVLPWLQIYSCFVMKGTL